MQNGTPCDYEFVWLDSIANVQAAEWAPLAGANALASWGWLRTIEQTAEPNWDLHYLTLRLQDKLVAAAICQLQEDVIDDRMDALVFGRVRPFAWRCGASLAPALICGPCGTYGSHLIFHPSQSESEREQVAKLLINAMEARARDLGVPLAFVHVLGTQTTLVSQLRNRGFAHTLLSPMAQLEIQWRNYAGYEEYLRSLSQNAFKTVRNERNRNARQGVVIDVLSEPEPHQERLIELLSMTSQKYSGVPFWYSDDYFSRLKGNLGDAATIYGAWKDERLIATCVMLRSETDGFLTEVGVDHKTAGNDFTYFNIAYYRPIEDAIEGGLTRLHLDNALHELKARRGCRLIPDRMFYKEKRPLRRVAISGLFAIHTLQFKRKHAYLERYSDR